MTRSVLSVALVMLAAAAGAAEPEFSLGLDRLDVYSLDPRTQARVDEWNDPMGRVTAHVQQEQAHILRGGQPGGSGGIAFRAKFQAGSKPRLVVAWADSGTDFYERSMGVIRWPWSEDDEKVLPLDEQLAILLGRRLEDSSVGGESRQPSP